MMCFKIATLKGWLLLTVNGRGAFLCASITKGGGKPCTKHMKVHQEMVKEHLENGEFDIKNIKTSLMIADMLMKVLSSTLFYKLVQKLLTTISQCMDNRSALSTMLSATSDTALDDPKTKQPK
jgi:hypothetical protein